MFKKYLKLGKFKASAFSLIELSIVILIISIIASGFLSTSKSEIKNKKSELASDRIKTISRALESFVILNKKLPCPASIITAKTNDNYGKIDSTDANCTNGAEGGVFLGGKSNEETLVYGMVPVKDLNLPNELAEDGFGSKISYVVDRRFTKKSDLSLSDGFDGTANDDKMITIQGPSGSVIAENVIVTLISHGPNKYGAYNSYSSNVQNSNSGASSDELSNIMNNLDNLFTANSADKSTFDDMVFYKTKSDITTVTDNNDDEFIPPSDTTCYNASNVTLPYSGYWSADELVSGGTPLIPVCPSYGGSSGSLSCVNGSWINNGGSCDGPPTSCPDSGKPSIANGSYPDETRLDGEYLNATCLYGITGTPRILCTTGSWGSTVDGSCNGPTSCPNSGKPSIANGSYPSGTRLNGESLDATCFYGTTGTPRIFCHNGSWGPTVNGSCDDATSCPNSGKPSIANGSYPSGTKLNGEYLNAVCYYRTNGTPRTLCNNGTWDPTTNGSCTLNTCPAYTGSPTNSGKKYRILPEKSTGSCHQIEKYSPKKGTWKHEGFNDCCNGTKSVTPPYWYFGTQSKGEKANKCNRC